MQCRVEQCRVRPVAVPLSATEDGSRMERIRIWAGRLLLVISGLLVIVSVIPMVQTNLWWVRVWDFPRPQLLVLSVIALVMLVWLRGFRRYWYVMPIALLGAIALQARYVVIYSPLWPVEMISADGNASVADRESDDDGTSNAGNGGDNDAASVADAGRATHAGSCVKIMVSNVYMENRESGALLDLLEQEQPDIAFIVENDEWWSDELRPVSSQYRSVIDQPLDNTYGLLFMTNLAADDIQLRHLTAPTIPSIRADLRLPNGDLFHFFGLHPKPPRPGQDTDLRDHELAVVAREVRDLQQQTAIVGGDLNDVAWSHTTRLFKRVSEMLDPRQGRGLYASFNAKHPLMRWPLDHLFATSDFTIARMAVLPEVNSDHFPVLGTFCRKEQISDRNASQEPMQEEDREGLQESLQNE